MDTDYKFNKAELADFKRFWEGEVGQKYIKKMKETKDQLLQAAMQTPDGERCMYHAAVANGFESVLRDIEATIKAADEQAKEGKTAKKK
jgi:hypothetical protein